MARPSDVRDDGGGWDDGGLWYRLALHVRFAVFLLYIRTGRGGDGPASRVFGLWKPNDGKNDKMAYLS